MATVEMLDARVEYYDNDFLARHTKLGTEALNDYIDAINYNEYQPLVDFESKYAGYYSLRKKIARDKAEWLGTNRGDFTNNPDNHFIISDDIRAILNHKGQVRIEDTIYIAQENGGWVEVYNADLGAVSAIETGLGVAPIFDPCGTQAFSSGSVTGISTGTETGTTGITGIFTPPAANCDNTRDDHRMDGSRENGAHDRRIDWKLKIENVFGIWHRVVGKVDGYKKKNNGNLTDYKSDL